MELTETEEEALKRISQMLKDWEKRLGLLTEELVQDRRIVDQTINGILANKRRRPSNPNTEG
jgi:hypothetical protein